MGKGRLNQKGFMDLINATDRSEVLNQIYRQVYPTKIGFEALIPFEQAKERTFRITRKKPIKFVLTTGDLLGQKDKLIQEYTKPEYIEDYVSIEKAFVFGREYSSLENLTPELLRADLDEIATAEVIYKRKAFLDMIQKEAPALEVEADNIKEQALDIHDQMMDYLMEVGINIPNVWIFSNLDINRAIRDKLKLNIGASAQIQQVLDGKDMILNGISSSIEGVNYVGLPKKVSALGPDGTPVTLKLLEDDVLIIAIEMNTEYRPFIAKDWTHTPLRVEKNPVGNGKGAVDVLEYVKGYDVLPVEPLKMVVIKKKINKKPIADVIKVTDLSAAKVPTPVPTNDDKPLGAQIANNVIELNSGSTINDFNIDDSSVVVTKKPVDGKTDADYQYGEFTATLIGSGQFTGTLKINGKFGRLISKTGGK